ncbi:MAG: hypothetical protein GX359_05505 [Clostridiales bacterium]|nr:hypothetical protein [Clostridiales bacterium]
MKALLYLLITQLKNRMLALKKKPALLILYIFIALMLFLVIFVSIMMEVESTQLNFADERVIYMILGGIGLLFLGTFITTGLSTGSTLFTMSDVGLLFVAPISSKKILLYGLVSTLGKTILASFFILYQIVNLKANFGYGLKEILALYLIYVIITIVGQLLSIATYIYSNGNTKRKKVIQTVLYFFAGIFLVTTLIIQRNQQVSLYETVLRIADSSWFGYVPVGGWAVMFFKGIVEGAIFDVLLSILCFTILSILFVVFLTRGTADYYEDVLHSTEITHQKLKAAKEGKKYSQRNRKVKVKDNEYGLQKGKGASAIAYKNILEMKRKSRLVYINGYTIIASIGAAIAGYNIKGEVIGAYTVLGALLYLQFFLTAFGPFKFELAKPYIYLIPEKSIKKLLAVSINSIIKPCIDGVIIFAVLTISGGCNPLTAIFLALAYAACCALFVGMTILYQRVLGAQPNMLAKAFVGIGLIAVFLGPSIISSVIVAAMLPDALLFLSSLPFTICCILFTIIIFLLCGNMLDKVEYSEK